MTTPNRDFKRRQRERKRRRRGSLARYFCRSSENLTGIAARAGEIDAQVGALELFHRREMIAWLYVYSPILSDRGESAIGSPHRRCTLRPVCPALCLYEAGVERTLARLPLVADIVAKAENSATEALWTRAQDGFEAAFGAAKSASLRKALEYVVSEDFVTAFNRRG